MENRFRIESLTSESESESESNRIMRCQEIPTPNVQYHPVSQLPQPTHSTQETKSHSTGTEAATLVNKLLTYIHLKCDMSRLWSQGQSGVSALTFSVANTFTVSRTRWQNLQCTAAAVNKLAAYLMHKLHFLPQLLYHTHTHTHIWHHGNTFLIKDGFYQCNKHFWILLNAAPSSTYDLSIL